MKDLFGKALLDYQRGNYTEDLQTETNISEIDVLPLPYLFRSYLEMPLIEQTALDLSFGKVLDVGCGAGSHALYLQQKGLWVMAIDKSPGAVTVASERGVQNVALTELLQLQHKKFDTILLLMNGIGVFESLERLPAYLEKLKELLNPGGQVLADSSDLIYMYDRCENGGVIVPGDRYYGELDYTVHYKGESEESFPWLYLDSKLFEELASETGFQFEIVCQGEHYDYLCRLSLG